MAIRNSMSVQRINVKSHKKEEENNINCSKGEKLIVVVIFSSFVFIAVALTFVLLYAVPNSNFYLLLILIYATYLFNF